MALVRMWRPSIALLLSVVSASSSLLLEPPRLVPPVEAAGGRNRPNVLIIVTDDQRAGTLKVMPATRRLIRSRGARYPNAYTTTPTCCPSRASIFTGRYPHNHGVRTNDGTTTDNLNHATTLQAYLQEAGYRTALFGKYLNGWDVEVRPPYFDRWALFTGPSRGYYSGNRWNIDGRTREVTTYSTRFIRKKTLDFIGSRGARNNPWLTFVTTAAPHAPFTPDDKYMNAKVPAFEVTPAMKERDRTDKPPYVQEVRYPLRASERVHKAQLRTLLSVDDLVASVFRKLRRTRQAKNTIVFFLSDNGYMHSEHGLTGKTAPYLPSVEIPMLLRAPRRLERGATDRRLVANIDVAPTVMDAVGLAPPDARPMDGRSLLDPTWSRDGLLLEYFRRAERATPEWAATLTRQDQYVEYYRDGGQDPIFREYYDLVLDPHQLENTLGNDDDSDDPPTLPVRAQQLGEDRNCRGSTGADACP